MGCAPRGSRGMWNEGGVADGGWSEFDWSGEGAAPRDDMENGYLRTEFASAKRKAAAYQKCMLEAEVYGSKPQFLS